MVRIEAAGRNDFLDFRDRDLPCRRHVRIEVSGSLSIDEIAFGVGLPGLDDRDVRSEPRLANIECPVELLDRLSVGDHRADARLRNKSGDACPARANERAQSAQGLNTAPELTR